MKNVKDFVSTRVWNRVHALGRIYIQECVWDRIQKRVSDLVHDRIWNRIHYSIYDSVNMVNK